MSNDFKNDISSKYKTPILQRILLEKEMSNKDISTAINNIHYEINTRIIKAQESIDNELIKKLYEIYKDSNISELIIIDEVQFKHFLSKYLPIYIKEVEE